MAGGASWRQERLASFRSGLVLPLLPPAPRDIFLFITPTFGDESSNSLCAVRLARCVAKRPEDRGVVGGASWRQERLASFRSGLVILLAPRAIFFDSLLPRLKMSGPKVYAL